MMIPLHPTKKTGAGGKEGNFAFCFGSPSSVNTNHGERLSKGSGLFWLPDRMLAYYLTYPPFLSSSSSLPVTRPSRSHTAISALPSPLRLNMSWAARKPPVQFGIVMKPAPEFSSAQPVRHCCYPWLSPHALRHTACCDPVLEALSRRRRARDCPHRV